jgi:nitrate reductase gamma subunit
VKAPRWVGWTMLVVAALLILFGWFVLGFLTEPSAVGRIHTLLEAIGDGSIVLGIAGAVAGLWILLRRRT